MNFVRGHNHILPAAREDKGRKRGGTGRDERAAIGEDEWRKGREGKGN